MTPDQWRIVRRLSRVRISRIDSALLRQASLQWRKVARVVGAAMLGRTQQERGVPDIYYAKRVRALVRKGLLESQGKLRAMRYSEVRLPAKRGSNAI